MSQGRRINMFVLLVLLRPLSRGQFVAYNVPAICAGLGSAKLLCHGTVESLPWMS